MYSQMTGMQGRQADMVVYLKPWGSWERNHQAPRNYPWKMSVSSNWRRRVHWHLLYYYIDLPWRSICQPAYLLRMNSWEIVWKWKLLNQSFHLRTLWPLWERMPLHRRCRAFTSEGESQGALEVERSDCPGGNIALTLAPGVAFWDLLGLSNPGSSLGKQQE